MDGTLHRIADIKTRLADLNCEVGQLEKIETITGRNLHRHEERRLSSLHGEIFFLAAAVYKAQEISRFQKRSFFHEYR